MNIFGKLVFISISLIYNLFIHYLTSMMYKDLPYAEKHNKTVVLLVVAGIIGIFLGKVVLKRKQDGVVDRGLFIGGIMLVFTGFIANWENISDEIKLFASGVGLIIVIWLSYKYLDKKDNKKKKKKKN